MPTVTSSATDGSVQRPRTCSAEDKAAVNAAEPLALQPYLVPSALATACTNDNPASYLEPTDTRTDQEPPNYHYHVNSFHGNSSPFP